MNQVDQSILRLVKAALQEDIGPGDLTSLACLDLEPMRARIVAKSEGVLSGTVPTQLAFRTVDPATIVRLLLKDGDRFKRGDVVAELEGFNQTILTAERTALNILAHLSGIATLTAKFVERAGGGARILDTRKTTPGWRSLEKQAVVHGGGENHRMGLYDMILIKDNHIAAAGSITQAVAKAREYASSLECCQQFNLRPGQVGIEVEVTSEAEVVEAIGAGANRLLLDNQSVDSLRNLVVKARAMKPDVELEASGNVTLETVGVVAKTGVDYISVGALTHSAPACDFSLGAVP